MCSSSGPVEVTGVDLLDSEGIELQAFDLDPSGEPADMAFSALAEARHVVSGTCGNGAAYLAIQVARTGAGTGRFGAVRIVWSGGALDEPLAVGLCADDDDACAAGTSPTYFSDDGAGD